jgi:hypothetical protein
VSTSSTDARDELDRVILDSASELCRQLGITDYTPSKVVWSRLDPRFQDSPRPVGIRIDEPLVLLQDQIVIHEELRRILGEDQLRALVAYALVRQRKTGTHGLVLFLIATITLISIAVLGFLFLPVVFPERSPYATDPTSRYYYAGPVGYVFAWGLIPFLVVLGIGLTRLYNRRRIITIDRQIANLLGREPVLSALKTINASAPPTPKHRIGPDWEYNRRLKIVRMRIRALEEHISIPN